MRAKFLLATLVVMGALAVTASKAEAQYYGYGYGPRPVYAQPGFNREGLTVGFALGGGLVKADAADITGGGWVSFRIGGMLNRRFALLFDTENVFFPATLGTQSATGYSGMSGLGGQLFFDPVPLWLKVAAGFAYFGAQGDFTGDFATIYGFGFSVGLGVDLVKFRHPYFPWAISLETQVTPMFFRAQDIATTAGNTSGKLVNWTVGVGFQWY